MAEPFKQFINATLVQTAADCLTRHWPDFDRAAFVCHATTGLDDLELKARATQVADALMATLPEEFDRAADILEASLTPPAPDQHVVGLAADADGLAGWILWPVGEYVSRRGLEHPERALQALHAITQRFTAEFAIRPLLVAHPERVFATLAQWVTDDSAHVRRLVSEGSRPRLPWGIRLQQLVVDPSPTLPLLLALQDDPSEYVRRSVANHLNDIAKDHPELVADWLDTHLPSADAARRAMLRHASRTLIKKGHTRVLTAWGVGTPFAGTATVQATPARVSVGDRVELSLTLQSSARTSQELAIDYLVHHVKADGNTSPKVFKGWTITLDANASRTLVKRHSMKRITTRRYYPGVHRVEVQVNGQAVCETVFTLD